MRVVITGAARGLGAALTSRFLSARHSVIAVDCDWQNCEPGAQPEAHMRLQADLRDPTDIARLVSDVRETGSVDVVIHNAGINATGPFDQIAVSAMCRVIEVNLRAPILMTSALLKQQLIAENGTLVFIGSLSSHLSYPGAAAYAASKDGLLSFARSLTPSLAKRNIACLSVLPGPLDTQHARHHAPQSADGTGRLDPAIAADKIYAALQRQRKTLVPGWRARIYSRIGTTAPWLAERIMRKAVFLPLCDTHAETVREMPK